MKVSQLLKAIKGKSEGYEFCVKHRKRAADFSRTGKKLSFMLIVMYVIRLVKLSTVIEIMKFFREIGKDEDTARRNSINEGRGKISETAFSEIFEMTAESGKEMESAEEYKGFRLYGFDGTTVKLENSDELKEHFGKTTPTDGQVMARIHCVVDVLNGVIADGDIGAYQTGEREMAMQAVERLGEQRESLYMFDRGYWSPELVDKVMESGGKFLMRMPSTARAAVTKSADNSGYFKVEHDGRTHALRFFKFVLASGEVEILATNLTHEQMPDEFLPELYSKRWGIETKYSELKTRLEIDRFSGKSVLFVKQDFFATLVISNLVAMFAHEKSLELTRKNKDKPLKNPQKTNIALGIGIFREYFVEIMFCPSDRQRNKLFDKLFKLLSLSVSCSRSDRVPRQRNDFAIRNKRSNRPKSVL